MHTLLAFLPAEKVVVDQTSNGVSISSILEECKIGIPAGLPPPSEGMFIPVKWTIFSLWRQKEGGPQTPFETKIRLDSPDGRTLLETPTVAQHFENFTKNSQRLMVNINAFPIWATGLCNLVLMYRTTGESEFREVARYPLMIIHEQGKNSA